jgi:hypothetical protein
MTSKHTYFIMIGVICLMIIAVIGGTYLASEQLGKYSKKLADYKTQNEVLAQEQVALNKAKKDIEKYSELEKIAKAVVPQDKDQAQAVREIIKIAGEAGIKPTAINFPASSLGTAGSAASSSAGTSSGAALGSKTKALSQLTPVKGISGVYNLQITVAQDATAPVPYAKFLDFLSRLEKNRRTAQVVGIVLQPSATNRNMVSFTLTIDEYIKP